MCCGVARKVPLPVLVEGAWLQKDITSTGSANGIMLAVTRGIFYGNTNKFWGVAGLCKGIAPQRG